MLSKDIFTPCAHYLVKSTGEYIQYLKSYPSLIQDKENNRIKYRTLCLSVIIPDNFIKKIEGSCVMMCIKSCMCKCLFC